MGLRRLGEERGGRGRFNACNTRKVGGRAGDVVNFLPYTLEKRGPGKWDLSSASPAACVCLECYR